VSDGSGTHASANLRITCSSGNAAPQMPMASPSTYTPQTGDWVVVEIVYRYALATPLISSLASTITLDQTTTMVLE
jgi:hypothetical protein